MRDSPAGPSVLGVGSDSAASGIAETPEREVCSDTEAELAGALASARSVLPLERDVARLHACTRAHANPPQSR